MQTIKLKDAQFTLIIGLPEVRDIRAKLGIDMLDRDGIAKACESLIDFADVLFVCLDEQVKQSGMDEREFYDLLLENCEAAVDAFLEELSDFFRRCGKAALAQLAAAVVETTRESDRMAEEMLTTETQQKLTQGHLRKERRKRQRALDRLLKEGAETPGEKSPA